MRVLKHVVLLHWQIQLLLHDIAQLVEARLVVLRQRLLTPCRTNGWCIFNVQQVISAWRNYLIVRACLFRDQTGEEIIRRGTGVVKSDAHSGSRKENQ